MLMVYGTKSLYWKSIRKCRNKVWASKGEGNDNATADYVMKEMNRIWYGEEERFGW